MSENVNVKKENTEGKLKISEKNLAIIITAAILAVVAIATAIVFVVNAVKNDSGFNYLKSDLHKYIEFPEDYKSFTVNLDIAEPKDIDVDVALLKLLASAKEGSGNEKDLSVKSYEIGAGDVVSIRYRGYILGEDGKQIAVDGMCNFADASSYSLTIGSGSFVPGFELDLVGKLTGDSNKFEKITTGKPKANQIAYVSYSRIETSGSTTKTVTVTSERIDLSRDDIDAIYGENFKSTLMSTEIGTAVKLPTSVGDVSYGYSDLTVKFVTECEDKHLTVECYFPYNYSKEELRNETGYFEVYVDKFEDYTVPTLDDEFLKKKIEDKTLKVSLETLEGYTGASLVEKYRAYAEETLMKDYEEEYDLLLLEEILQYYRDNTKVKKYPGVKVNELFDEYYNQINDSYITSGGKITNSYGSSNTYQTLDTYAVAYLGLTGGADWQAHIRGEAESAVKERLILYYIVRYENLIPSETEFKTLVAQTKEMLVEEYIEQYLAYEGKTAEDYDDYDAFVQQCRDDLFGYYDEAYFEESTYLEIMKAEVLTWPEVVTLDDRRAYPQEK